VVQTHEHVCGELQMDMIFWSCNEEGRDHLVYTHAGPASLLSVVYGFYEYMMEISVP
jgi:hypothetical protein